MWFIIDIKFPTKLLRSKFLPGSLFGASPLPGFQDAAGEVWLQM